MTENDGTSFSDADEAPEDDVTQDDTAQDTAQDDAPAPNAGAHPIIDEPDSSLGQAAIPAPDTSAESQIEETE